MREVVHCLCVHHVGNTCERDNCSVASVESIGTGNIANPIHADPGIAHFVDNMPRMKEYAMLHLKPT